MDLAGADFDEVTAALQTRAVSSVELVGAYQRRIEDLDVGGPALRSVRALCESAAEQAAAADRARGRGGGGPLLGVPVLVKDNIDVAGMATTAGSLALHGWNRGVDSEAVRRLRRAGAVILGKTNMTEWANFMASGMPAGYSAAGGQVRNPYDTGRSPGGSSSGSAVAVAAGLCPLAVGTETMGSILSPADACSVVGVRPTPGTTGRRGVVPVASSYDTVGPLAATVKGAAALLGALRGGTAPPVLHAGAVRGARLGVLDTAVPEGAERLWADAVAAFADLGAVVVAVSPEAGPHDPQVMLFEFRRDIDAYLGGLAPEAPVHSLAEVVEFNRSHPAEELAYGQSILLRCLEIDVTDARTQTRYELARRADLLTRNRLGSVLAQHRLEALLFPAAASAPLAARAGCPSVSVPAGYSDDRQPFGVSLLGPAGSDGRLLSIASALEDVLGARRPPILAG